MQAGLQRLHRKARVAQAQGFVIAALLGLAGGLRFQQRRSIVDGDAAVGVDHQRLRILLKGRRRRDRGVGQGDVDVVIGLRRQYALVNLRVAAAEREAQCKQSAGEDERGKSMVH